MKAQDFLKAGLGHMQDRAATYDKPTGERSMSATVGAFKCVSGVEMTEEQGWLFMGLLKMVRSQQGEFRADNYEDEAAYAALRGECAFTARATVKESLAVEIDGEPGVEGWIKWDGGECPVKDGDDVSVRFHGGKIRRDKMPKTWSGWGVNCPEPEYKIIAYRIHKAGE